MLKCKWNEALGPFRRWLCGPRFGSGAADDGVGDGDAGRGCLDGIAAARSATRLPTGVGGLLVAGSWVFAPGRQNNNTAQKEATRRVYCCCCCYCCWWIGCQPLSVCVCCVVPQPRDRTRTSARILSPPNAWHMQHQRCNILRHGWASFREAPGMEWAAMERDGLGPATGLDLVLGSWALPCATLGNVRGRGRGLDSCARFTPSQGQACQRTTTSPSPSPLPTTMPNGDNVAQWYWHWTRSRTFRTLQPTFLVNGVRVRIRSRSRVLLTYLPTPTSTPTATTPILCLLNCVLRVWL